MIFILGVDGLEHYLINKWNLNNLKQSEYGKIKVPINEKTGVPMSPEVWASFLVGKYITKNFTTSSSLKPLLGFLNFLHISIYNGIGKKAKNFAKKLGFRFPPRMGGLEQKTFLDLTNSIEINAPYYSYDHAIIDICYLFGEGKLSLNQTIEKVKHIYEKRKIQILNEIMKIDNPDVIFAYIHTTDALQHLMFNHISEIRKYYVNLDAYFHHLKSKLNEKFKRPIILIISDHGFDFKVKDHSKYGFYSSNINLIPKPEEITDFYKIIIAQVGMEGMTSQREVEYVKERLRRLGYI